MSEKENSWRSSALSVNLARTAATIEIPEKYQVLLKVVENYYGVHKRTIELLEELNHPYVNWEFIAEHLKTLSLNDFYKHNTHKDGLDVLKIIVEMYLDIIRLAQSQDVKDRGIQYLFDYITMVLSESKEFLQRNSTLLPLLIESLLYISKDHISILKKTSTYVKPVLKFLISNEMGTAVNGLHTFLFNVFSATYQFWLTQPDPKEWFNSYAEAHSDQEAIDTYHDLIEPLSHYNLKMLLDKLEVIHTSAASGNGNALSSYLNMPDYFKILNGYLLIANEIERSRVYEGHQHLVKLNFLFNIINIPGLADIHGASLRESNRSLTMVFRQEDPQTFNDFVRKVFTLLKRSASRSYYQDTIMNCINTVAKEIFELSNHPLADIFIEEAISFGFQYPKIQGSNIEWQVKVNPAHIKNIRSWLEIISLKPRWTKRLLSALIINLKLGGLFVRDTDLLQRDISALLNSGIAPAYNLVKQLLRIFPIYFSEIGAEGELRDISTKVDELSFRNDKLVNFVRKQSHVESNSLLVSFIENIFRYWYSKDKKHVKDYLPHEIYEQIINSGEYFDGLYKLFSKMFPKINNDPHVFLEWDKAKIEKEAHSIKGVTNRDKERAILMIRLYQLLYKKYNPQHIDLLKDLEAAGLFDQSKIQTLERSLRRKDCYKSLTIILDFLTELKEQILSPEKTPSFENIYHKRHIAAGIPSMYGTYREEKFDAVGLSLRLESLATVLFEQLIQSLNLKFITKNTLTKIHEYLWLFVKALDLEGIATEGLVAKIKYITSALQIKLFSIDQYLNIFQFISKDIQDIIRDYYIDAHSSNIPIIIKQILHQNYEIAEHAISSEDEEARYQMSENFIRSAISSAFGLQVLDNFISNIIRTLSAELEKFQDNKEILNLVMTYDPDITLSPIYKANKKIDNQILLGNKGYFLKQLKSFDFPVPPGFIITTEVFRCYDGVFGYKYISNDLILRIYNELANIEKMTGRRFGDPHNPLFLSVRSGATISLPGMMNSFLNVGINEDIAEGISKKRDYQWAAWDSYRRFLQTWGMFQGLDRNFFDQIINTFKQKYNIAKKINFSYEQMRAIALAYRKAMEQRGIEIIDNPRDQLQHAILQVFASWYSTRAQIYRHQTHISDDWGTAVIIQAMVFGNLNKNSGSGVTFTRNPKGVSSEVSLYGDFIFGIQGDDIVSGLVETYPISENQRKAEQRASEVSLETRFPKVYEELLRLSQKLIYEKRFNHQELEFTFENTTKEGLYILQTRDMVQAQPKTLKIFKDTTNLRKSFLGTGVGVGGGALCGRAVYSEKQIKSFRTKEPNTPLILIRPDTVPDDVGVLLQVDGLLTAKGGSTSHAAVTIPQLKKVGVVGFSSLDVYEADGRSIIEGHVIKDGHYLCIDGWSGAVYLGKHEVEPEGSYKITI